MIVLGYTLGIMMGLTLGLIGAGGSILTVPILVYLLDIKPMVATGYSLLIVGSAAFTGAVCYWQRGLVNLRAALMFSVPAMIMVLVARTFIVPAIPDPLAGISKDIFIMMLFAGLMIAASLFMLNPLQSEKTQPLEMHAARVLKLVIGSASVGLLTGMVGAGGGFLIIPTLIALFGLPVKEAIGTSLAIVATNSLVGFQGDIASGIPLDWHLLGLFVGLTLLGMWIGTTLAKRMNSGKLKKIFGVFTLLVGLAVLAKELHELFQN